MKVLATSVLVFEAIVVALGIPVGVISQGKGAWYGWTGAVLALLCLVVAGMVRRSPRRAVAMGWALQIGVLAFGVFVPEVLFIGAVFVVLWWAAIHFGTKADAIHEEHLRQRDSGSTEG